MAKMSQILYTTGLVIVLIYTQQCDASTICDEFENDGYVLYEGYCYFMPKNGIGQNWWNALDTCMDASTHYSQIAIFPILDWLMPVSQAFTAKTGIGRWVRTGKISDAGKPAYEGWNWHVYNGTYLVPIEPGELLALETPCCPNSYGHPAGDLASANPQKTGFHKLTEGLAANTFELTDDPPLCMIRDITQKWKRINKMESNVTVIEEGVVGGQDECKIKCYKMFHCVSMSYIVDGKICRMHYGMPRFGMTTFVNEGAFMFELAP